MSIEISDHQITGLKNDLLHSLNERSGLQQFLFRRGFLITEDTSLQTAQFPFYNNWNEKKIGNYRFLVHKDQTSFFSEIDGKYFFLIGHAYNPFSEKYDENILLKSAAAALEKNIESYQDEIDQWTGIFITGYITSDEFCFQLDASGMQYACYGKVNGKFCIASHIELPRDLYALSTSKYIHKLINYRFYPYMLGHYFPGDLTPFDSFKRIIPNTRIKYSDNVTTITRFYPQKPRLMCKNESDYKEVIAYSAEIMKKNLELIAQKWEKPAISLTGGIDSNTTFAAANGLYDRYTAFSYVSMYRESVDADAAASICRQFSVPHTVYSVPNHNEEIADFDIMKAILWHNAGYIGHLKDSDTRKKIIMQRECHFDIEVKSWISETIRAYAYKYFGRKQFPKKIRPRDFSLIYKLFFFNRGLLRETTKYFADYFRDTDLQDHLFNYDATDLFVWEMMHGGKCGLNIGSMKYCFNITIPYNNRNWLDLLLRTPLQKRIDDTIHQDMKKLLNQKLYDMNIRVVNLNETKKRKYFLNSYYSVNRLLPF